MHDWKAADKMIMFAYLSRLEVRRASTPVWKEGVSAGVKRHGAGQNVRTLPYPDFYLFIISKKRGGNFPLGNS